MKPLNKPKVFISPGHRSINRGARNDYFRISEWEICNIIVSNILETTHDNDINFIGGLDNNLLEKVSIANFNNVDFAIDIHLNACDGIASGSECLYWHNSQVGCALADYIDHNLYYNRCRPLKSCSADDNFYFLQYTSMPAVIVELGFIDNNDDLIAVVSSIKVIRNAIRQAIISTYRNVLNEDIFTA